MLVIRLARKIKFALGSLWWYSALLFVAMRVADFINLYVGGKQAAFAYKVQRNNSWDVKVKDQNLMDELNIEKAQFAGMASEALFFYSKYWPIKKAYDKATKENTQDLAKLSGLIDRAVKYAEEKQIAI